MLVYCSPAAYATRAACAAPMQEVFLRSKIDGRETRMFFERITGNNHLAQVERTTQDLQPAC